MLDIIIVGAGGFGREVYEMAKEIFVEPEYKIRGFLSDDLEVLDGFNLDIPILGTIKDYKVCPNDRFLVAIGSVDGKKKIVEFLKAQEARFLSLVHPEAKIFSSAVIGEGSIIYPYAFVSSNVKIGDFCLLNAFAGCGHDAVVGDYSVLCPYSVLLGWASIEEESFIATHATVGPKVKLGKRAKVSANSAALRSAADDAFICGVPGKVF